MKAFLLILLLTSVLCDLKKGLINSVAIYQETNELIDILDASIKEKISVKAGAPFLVKLPSNPTTGYEWFVKRKELKNIVHMDKEEDGEITPVESELAGAPTTQVFVFMPNRQGEDTISFVYKQGWTQDDSTIYTIHVDIQ